METYKLTVNGQPKEVAVDPGTPLLWVLREELKMTGTKYGCGIAACVACTVHVARIATRSCVVPVSLVGDRPVVTIEGIGQDTVGRAVQDAWVSEDVVQCGYCQSGQIMGAVALLKSTPKPTDTNIEESMGGNICRCGTYVRIRQAIKSASQQLSRRRIMTAATNFTNDLLSRRSFLRVAGAAAGAAATLPASQAMAAAPAVIRPTPELVVAFSVDPGHLDPRVEAGVPGFSMMFTRPCR